MESVFKKRFYRIYNFISNCCIDLVAWVSAVLTYLLLCILDISMRNKGKAISIYNELACLSESSEYLNNNDALSITIEKLLIGRIQWSNNLSHIRRALQMLSIIMTNILTARDDESTINHYCSIIAHSVWKYAESNSVDDFIILIQCLMNTFPSPADYLALIRIAISLNKPVGLIELNKETINSIIEHTPLLKIR
jgi:hypothetical protein